MKKPDSDKKHGTDAPFCKLCKSHHWGRDPHAWEKRTKKKTKRKKK
jgi:hypothetical protein